MELWNFSIDITQNHVLLVLGILFAISLSWGHAFLGLPVDGFAIAGLWFLPAVLFLIFFNEAIVVFHGIDLLKMSNVHVESVGRYELKAWTFPLDISLKMWRMEV